MTLEPWEFQDRALSNEYIRYFQEEETKKDPPHLTEPSSPRKAEATRPEKAVAAEPPADNAIPSSFHLHQKVEARYHGRGRRYYPGQIVNVLGGGRYDVDYDDGDKDRNLHSSHIRALEVRSAGLPQEISISHGQRVSVVSGTTAQSVRSPIQDEETGSKNPPYSSPARSVATEKNTETTEPSVSSSPLRHVHDERERSRNALEAITGKSVFSPSCEAAVAKGSVSPQRNPLNSDASTSKLEMLECRIEACEKMLSDTNAKLDLLLERNSEAASLAKNLHTLLGGGP